MSGGRTRANSTRLDARVTLDLANRLRLHLVAHDARHESQGTVSDFVSAAIEEKLARESSREIDASEA